MKRIFVAALALAALASCHPARPGAPPPLSCFDNAVVTCEACLDRGCNWCSEGPNPSDGFCCQAGVRCEKPVTVKPQCSIIPNCDQAVINSCTECLDRNCAWCPGESRCRAATADGTFPACEGQLSGIADCPAGGQP